MVLHGTSLQSSKITENFVNCCIPFTFLSITLAHPCKCRPPYTPLLQSKIGVCKIGVNRGIPIHILLLNIDYGYSLGLSQSSGSNVYRQSMFWAKIRKNIIFFI